MLWLCCVIVATGYDTAAMIDLGKRKNRVDMLKEGFTEKQLAALYIRFKKYQVVSKVLFENEKQIVTNPDGINQYSDEVIRQNDGQPTETAVKIAEQYKVSPKTVERAAQFSKAIDKLEESG